MYHVKCKTLKLRIDFEKNLFLLYKYFNFSDFLFMFSYLMGYRMNSSILNLNENIYNPLSRVINRNDLDIWKSFGDLIKLCKRSFYL